MAKNKFISSLIIDEELLILNDTDTADVRFIGKKLLDTAAFGRASLVNANTPKGELCESEGIGITADYGDVSKIAEAIEQAHNIEITSCKGEDSEAFLSVVNKLLN